MAQEMKGRFPFYARMARVPVLGIQVQFCYRPGFEPGRSALSPPHLGGEKRHDVEKSSGAEAEQTWLARAISRRRENGLGLRVKG